MRIPTDEIPQADTIEDVVKTVICIFKGGRTFQDIAKAIGKVDRQGRYYRKSAEILGLITTPQRNYSILTELGEKFIRSGATITDPIFFQAIMNARIFQRLIPFFELNQSSGLSKSDIVDFIISVAKIDADTMASRRFSSVVSWLESLGTIHKKNDGRFYLSTVQFNKELKLLEFKEVSEPIMPRSTDFHEYETVRMRADKANDSIITYTRDASADRADNAHRSLVNLLSKRIRKAGAIPRCNQIIDLATNHDKRDYIFEVKSITDSNIKSQVRSAISQLYEYRYLQNLAGANLILVIEKPLPKSNEWMIDYLENDREISLVWDGDNNLYGRKETMKKLDFLGLIL